MSILIPNGTLLCPQGPVRADLRVAGERIAEIGPGLPPGDSRVLDASGRLVFPGFIDTHCHSRDGYNGAHYKEDFFHSSSAGAASGITTIYEMPNCNPAIYNVERMNQLIECITPKAHVDFGVWGLCLGDLNNDDLPKLAEAELTLDGGTVRLAGAAKGAGMICPNMATMISLVLCDADVDAAAWREMFRRAADATFNRVSVDGDTSTNDSLFGLANGASGIRVTEEELPLLEEALTGILGDLAYMLVKDGEGATKAMHIRVTGAASDADAELVARAVGHSQLVKTAMFGKDPNWGRIVAAAWQLFYEQGYEDTTIEDIVFESETSKGSFYHYFDGKDALLGTLSNVFDEKYEALLPALSPEQDAIEKLAFLNHELFAMIDGGISLDLLARLLSTQLLTRGEKHLLDRNRTYFKLLRSIIAEGQRAGQLRTDRTVNEIVKAYALWERALLYDWCLCGGGYSLVAYTDSMTPTFLESWRG